MADPGPCKACDGNGYVGAALHPCTYCAVADPRDPVVVHSTREGDDVSLSEVRKALAAQVLHIVTDHERAELEAEQRESQTKRLYAQTEQRRAEARVAELEAELSNTASVSQFNKIRSDWPAGEERIRRAVEKLEPHSGTWQWLDDILEVLRG